LLRRHVHALTCRQQFAADTCHDWRGDLYRHDDRDAWRMARIMGHCFPMTYFMPISIDTFTKGLGFPDLITNLAALAVFIPVLTLLSLVFLRKQER
jgi:hypothetical protein